MNPHQYSTEWRNDYQRLKSFLNDVDSQFHEPLSNRVTIEEYAQKLSKKAMNIWIMAAMKPVAHLAFYEDETCRILFVTSISVKKEHQRRNLGRTLIQEVIDYAKARQYLRIELEVDARSGQATAFYDKIEFVENTKVNQAKPYIKALQLDISD